jgi:hypothetical protein
MSRPIASLSASIARCAFVLTPGLAYEYFFGFALTSAKNSLGLLAGKPLCVTSTAGELATCATICRSRSVS